jgi:inhibitor of KinA
MTNILSESAVAIEFGDAVDLEIHRKVLAFNDWLSENPFPGLLAALPAYASLTVFFDPVLVKNHWREQPSPARAVQAFLEKIFLQIPPAQSPITNQPITFGIPVRYDGADLSEVAERLQLSENEVIRLHTEAIYTVFMVGFLPGFPYLGPLPAALRLPRRDTPRLRVPVGSVAIAGAQTGIYPQASPGGWHLLGRTDFPLFDSSQNPPARLQPGMQVRFVSA